MKKNRQKTVNRTHTLQPQDLASARGGENGVIHMQVVAGMSRDNGVLHML